MLHPEKPEKPGAANDTASFTGGFILQRLATQCTSASWCILSEICCFIFSGVLDERLRRDVMSVFVPCSDTEPRQRGGLRRALFLVLPDISFILEHVGAKAQREIGELSSPCRGCCLACTCYQQRERAVIHTAFLLVTRLERLMERASPSLVAQEAPSREPRCAVGGK